MSSAVTVPSLADAESAIRRNASYPPHWLQLGLALNAENRAHDALQAFAHAAALDPRYAEAHYNCGVILHHQGQLEAAAKRFRTALEHMPGFVMARSNLGVTLEAIGDTQAALAAYDEAIAAGPNTPSPYWNKALLLLRNGQYEQGWRYYEWRWGAGKVGPRRLFPGKRLWLGGGVPLAGKTILLHEEQGLGDMIQVIRYVPTVLALGAKVIVESFTPLTTLFQQLSALPGVEAVIDVGAPLPHFDVYCPLMSLPCALGTTLEAIPWNGPYLAAPADRVSEWTERLGPAKARRVAVVWKGNPRHEGDTARSIPLSDFKKIFEADAEFISLQKDATDIERALLDANGVQPIGHLLTDFADTAAVLATCDLVVTVDTSVAHLAGAMGKPVWILLPARSDWRWLKTGDTSPWYPTARLFRASQQSIWNDVLNQVVVELQNANRL